jgi:PAS domain S-box-containing protein
MTLSGEYRALLNAIQEAACLVDGQTFKLIAVNTAAVALIGEERQALIGRHVTNLAVTPEDLVFWDEVMASRSDPSGAEPAALHSESLIARADGSMVHVERRVERLESGEGHGLYLLTLLDQTSRLDTEAKLERLLSEMRATLESTADGILVTELNGSIQAFNRLFSQLWRLPAHLLTQRDDAAIYNCMRDQVLDPLAYDQRLAQIAGDARLEDSDRIALVGGRMLERVTLPQLGRGVSIGRVPGHH